MAMNGIQSLFTEQITHPNLLVPGANTNPVITEPSQFGRIFDAAVRLLDETSSLEQAASHQQFLYATGQTDDMLAVILAEQRAHTAVTFTTQITSRVMDAYRQIINMQV